MTDKKYNYLAAAEMDEEGNYNMIDGIINGIKKPSILDKIAEYERLIKENAVDDSQTDHSKDKMER